MSDWWGPHTPGEDCPCKPTRSIRWRDGIELVLQHNAPTEVIGDAAAAHQALRENWEVDR